MLRARCRIFYKGKWYEPGEMLPADEKMNALWKECGSAKDVKEVKKDTAKATPMTAQAGITGTVDGAATQDGTLVGVVKERGRKKTT